MGREGRGRIRRKEREKKRTVEKSKKIRKEKR